MRIWYDACTGKHVRYGTTIARYLRRKGYDVILTTRKHPDTIALAKFLGERVQVVGKYDPTSRLTRLRESLRRQTLLYKMFGKEPPDIAISHGSVDLCRVAFGLGIPNVSTHDSPHAEAVNRLTLPLADVVVVSEAIPEECLRKFGVKKIVRFSGVDEVAWIKDFKAEMRFDYGEPLIVVRQMETKAVYAQDKTDITEEIAKKLTFLGKVVFLSRYARKSKRNLFVPEGFIDSASLVAQAELVVSVGGTIAREAALQGIPSIVIPVLGHSYVNNYLAAKGFPIFTVDAEKVLGYAKKLIGKKRNVKKLLDELENPIEIIGKIVEKIKNGKNYS